MGGAAPGPGHRAGDQRVTRLSALFVNYNSWRLCVDAVLSLKNNPPTAADGQQMDYEVIVVDNCSPQSDPEAETDLETLLAVMHGRLIRHDENSGYAKGMNLALSQIVDQCLRQQHPALAVEGERVAAGQQRGGEGAMAVGEGIEAVDTFGQALVAVHAAGLDGGGDRRGIGDDALKGLLGEDRAPTSGHGNPSLLVDLVVEAREKVPFHPAILRPGPRADAGVGSRIAGTRPGRFWDNMGYHGKLWASMVINLKNSPTGE